ncbi:hypothetical protein [Xanthomonas bundabergensis]|uniref:hypothetical protein n=1 Tax=Xanthomonas bundabergensis TaxID=3160842 RepID=UPI0035160851
MKGIKAIVAAIALGLLSGCTLFNTKNGPVDVGRNAASVPMVIASLQRALDASGNHSAFDSGEAYKFADAKCAEETKRAQVDYDLKCPQLVKEARHECNNASGPAAVELCRDFLTRAHAQCDAGASTPKICAEVKRIGPLRIRSATFRFAATTVRTAGAGASLKLLSAKYARVYERASSYEIVMVPMPAAADVDHAIPYTSGDDGLYLQLSNALTAVLDAAVLPQEAAAARVAAAAEDEGMSAVARAVKQAADRAAKISGLTPAVMRVTGPKGATPGLMADFQPSKNLAPALMLNSARFTLDLNYSTDWSGEFTWTLSALKVADGTAGASSTNTIGNTLTIEFER